MTSDVFEELDGAIDESNGRAYWAVQAPFRPARELDVRLVSRVRGWERDRAARRSLAAFERCSDSAVTVRSADGVGLRLSDAALGGAQSRLESVDSPTRPGGGVARRAVVYFWGANTTKALHLGHLRDLAIGNALSAALSAGGMRVERRSLIADCGRGMGEAMAGVVGSGLARAAIEELPKKSDHFVGDCYSSYVLAQPAIARDPIEMADSVHREAVLHDDSADAILDRFARGDPDTRELWRSTRDWVMAGQLATLAALEVSFDNVIFESDFLEEMNTLSQLGVDAGLLTVREDGVLVYLTGHEELAEMPLARADGLPTQHLRALAYWASAPDLDDCLSIQVCGSEWVAHVTCRRQLIDELAKIAPYVDCRHPRQTIFHGMVAERGRRLASSEGALLIDHLVEWVEGEIAKRHTAVNLRDEAAGRVAARVALGFFLLQPLGRAIDVELPALLRPGSSLGWDLTLARAHCRAARAGDDPPDDSDYRFTILRAELLWRLLRSVAETLDVAPLARHASHFAQWLVEQERSPRVAHAATRVLDRSECALGLMSAERR